MSCLNLLILMVIFSSADFWIQRMPTTETHQTYRPGWWIWFDVLDSLYRHDKFLAFFPNYIQFLVIFLTNIYHFESHSLLLMPAPVPLTHGACFKKLFLIGKFIMFFFSVSTIAMHLRVRHKEAMTKKKYLKKKNKNCLSFHFLPQNLLTMCIA